MTKKIATTTLILLTLMSNSCASETFNLKRVFKVKATAYTHNEKDHIKYHKKTASGTNLHSGVAAADWSVFPVGTILSVNGKEYVVEDYGSALVGKDIPVIDIYQPTRSAMNKWGAPLMEIEVVKWGSFEESKSILESRLKYKHCREMYNNINF